MTRTIGCCLVDFEEFVQIVHFFVLWHDVWSEEHIFLLRVFCSTGNTIGHAQIKTLSVFSIT